MRLPAPGRKGGLVRVLIAPPAAIEDELLVGFYERGTGLPSMTSQESVDEALCFGWIDGVRTRIDEHAYKIRFSPRRRNSNWSAINIERVRALQSEGRMTRAGLEAFARRSEDKSRTYAYDQVKRAEFGPAQEAEFRRHKKAWTFHATQSSSYRHRLAWWSLARSGRRLARPAWPKSSRWRAVSENAGPARQAAVTA
jgi:uncharacterized protein YdeI (YjbR/CyaY-like superfamily)